jgi:hypothetical protein
MEAGQDSTAVAAIKEKGIDYSARPSKGVAVPQCNLMT